MGVAPEESKMLTETRTADAKARITLPKSFAGSTVIVEQVSETEVRIRKARVVAEDDFPFTKMKKETIRLSPADRDRFLAALENPPEPNAALLKLLGGDKKRQGKTTDAKTRKQKAVRKKA